LDEKDAIFIDENMLEKILEFGRMQRNKFFFFLKTFSIFFEIFWRKPGILIPDLYFIV